MATGKALNIHNLLAGLELKTTEIKLPGFDKPLLIKQMNTKEFDASQDILTQAESTKLIDWAAYKKHLIKVSVLDDSGKLMFEDEKLLEQFLDKVTPEIIDIIADAVKALNEVSKETIADEKKSSKEIPTESSSSS